MTTEPQAPPPNRARPWLIALLCVAILAIAASSAYLYWDMRLTADYTALGGMRNDSSFGAAAFWGYGDIPSRDQLLPNLSKLNNQKPETLDLGGGGTFYIVPKYQNSLLTVQSGSSIVLETNQPLLVYYAPMEEDANVFVTITRHGKSTRFPLQINADTNRIASETGVLEVTDRFSAIAYQPFPFEPYNDYMMLLTDFSWMYAYTSSYISSEGRYNWSYPGLQYAVDDFDGNGVVDFAIIYQARQDNGDRPWESMGVKLFTVEDEEFVQMYSSSDIPISAGPETESLAKYKGQYGVYWTRYDSDRDFYFVLPHADGSTTFLLNGGNFNGLPHINGEYVSSSQWQQLQNDLQVVAPMSYDQLEQKAKSIKTPKCFVTEDMAISLAYNYARKNPQNKNALPIQYENCSVDYENVRAYLVGIGITYPDGSGNIDLYRVDKQTREVKFFKGIQNSVPFYF